MESFLNLNDVLVCNSYFLIGSVFLFYLVYRILHSLLSDSNYIRTRYRVRGHTWRSIQCNKSVPYNIYCTNCGELMLPTVGLFCECCAVSACKRCHRAIDKKLRCKPVAWTGDKPFYHHWVHVGTIQTETVDQPEEGLRRYFCSWCQRSKLCAYSLTSDTEHCDFQKYRNIIIPPACVQLEKGRVSNIKHPGDNDWEPFIILANPKSGSNRSDELLSLFRGLLNPIQVVDISSTSPESVVRWLPPKCRILVAGGDGTVAWVMNSLFSFPNVKNNQDSPNNNKDDNSASNSQSLEPPVAENLSEKTVEMSQPASEMSSIQDKTSKFISPGSNIPQFKKRKVSQVSSLINEIKVIKEDLNSSREFQEPELDEHEIFAKYVASQLKKLSPGQAILARDQINATLSRCRMYDLNFGNTTFSYQSPINSSDSNMSTTFSYNSSAASPLYTNPPSQLQQTEQRDEPIIHPPPQQELEQDEDPIYQAFQNA